MILRNKRQVVIINDIKSDKIEQAIFILRDRETDKVFSKNSGDSDIVLEAHRIINGFLYPNYPTAKAKTKKQIRVQGLMWLASSAIVVGITTLILNLIR